MLTKLDESVGRVTTALLEAGMLNNSVIVFTTDNGGPAASFDFNAASNWPLRGVRSCAMLQSGRPQNGHHRKRKFKTDCSSVIQLLKMM